MLTVWSEPYFLLKVIALLQIQELSVDNKVCRQPYMSSNYQLVYVKSKVEVYVLMN